MATRRYGLDEPGRIKQQELPPPRLEYLGTSGGLTKENQAKKNAGRGPEKKRTEGGGREDAKAQGTPGWKKQNAGDSGGTKKTNKKHRKSRLHIFSTASSTLLLLCITTAYSTCLHHCITTASFLSLPHCLLSASSATPLLCISRALPSWLHLCSTTASSSGLLLYLTRALS